MASLSNKLPSTLVALTLLVSVVSCNDESTAHPCPDSCSCTNTPPALGLICPGLNLTAIPVVNISAQIVDFSGNPLKELTNQTLAPIRDTRNLQILVLKACAIRSIHNHTFHKLRNLRFLDLSSNGISTLDAGVFTELAHLSEINLSENNITNLNTSWFAESAPIRVLNLTGNPIQRLEAHIFQHLFALEELRLDQCQLQFVDTHAFDGLTKLHTLDLSHNHLVSVTAESIMWLRELHTLALTANPWQCDCNLQALTVILLIRGFGALAANLTCSTGATQLTKWIDANSTHPDCAKHINMHARKTTILGNSAQHRIKAAKVLLTNTSRSAPHAQFSSQAAAATSSTFSSVTTVSIWCAVIIVVAVVSSVGIYVASKMCVYATTKATSVAKHAATTVSRTRSIVRQQKKGCEQALVDDTAQLKDHFYLVDEVDSDITTSLNV